MTNRRLRFANRAAQVAVAAMLLAIVANLIDHYVNAKSRVEGPSQHEKNVVRQREIAASTDELLDRARKQNAEFKEGVAKAQKRLEAAEAREAAEK
jgi:hypothetical protein